MFWSTRPPGGCEDNLFSCFVFCYDNDNHVDHDLQDDDVQDGQMLQWPHCMTMVMIMIDNVDVIADDGDVHEYVDVVDGEAKYCNQCILAYCFSNIFQLTGRSGVKRVSSSRAGRGIVNVKAGENIFTVLSMVIMIMMIMMMMMIMVITIIVCVSFQSKYSAA